jgi:hypothetical protein
MKAATTVQSAYRALGTINAPLRLHIDAPTLVDCLRLQNIDPRWQPHMRAFFGDINIDILMDMVVDGAVTFDDLSRALLFWHIEDTDSARWIREMAPVGVAGSDDADARGHRLDLRGR